jgi:putative ABC transport system permease protein
VSRAFARQHFPDGEAVSRSLLIADDETRTLFSIVGVVEDVLDDGYANPAEPQVYVPLTQNPRRWTALAIRVAGSARGFIPALYATVSAVDPFIAVSEVRPLTDIMQATVSTRRGTLAITAVFAGLAFLLAGIGIYGVVAYTTASRIPEIGVRLALGADALSIRSFVVGDAARAAAAGLLVGLILAAGASHLLRSLLFSVSPLDPAALILTTVAVAALTFLAAWLPARRTARLSPAAALRYDT